MLDLMSEAQFVLWAYLLFDRLLTWLGDSGGLVTQRDIVPLLISIQS